MQSKEYNQAISSSTRTIHISKIGHHTNADGSRTSKQVHSHSKILSTVTEGLQLPGNVDESAQNWDAELKKPDTGQLPRDALT